MRLIQPGNVVLFSFEDHVEEFLLRLGGYCCFSGTLYRYNADFRVGSL